MPAVTSSDASETVVCFDLGGVLVRICRSWPEACTQARLPVRDAEALASEDWRVRRRAVVDQYQLGQLECRAYYHALSESLLGLYSPGEVEQIHDAWTLEEYPGIAQLVSELERRPGVTTACLSNTNHAHWQRLSGANGRAEYPSVSRLRHRLASHVLGLAKPDREIFRSAERAFFGGAAGRRAVVFFDDLPENVAAARDAGWTAFEIDPSGDTALQIRSHLGQAGVL